MSRRVLPLCLAIWTLSTLAACGGSGGGGSGPTPPPPPGTDNPPVLNVASPSGDVIEIPGARLRVAFTLADDGPAQARIFLDVDGDTGTTGDQTTLFTGPGQNGAPQVENVTIPGAQPLGSYALFVEADDGVNAPVYSPGTGVVLYPGLAGVAPTRSNTYGVSDDVVAFTYGEAENGTGALNGDGLSDDGVMLFLDTFNAKLNQTSFSADATPVAGGVPRVLRPRQQTFAWNMREQDQNADLNGDGDQTDTFVVIANPALNPVPILIPQGGMTLVPTLSEQRFFSLAKEANAGLDLNGDADQIDDVFFVIDVNGTPTPYGLDTPALNSPYVSAPLADRGAYFLDERIQGTNNTPGQDRNGDGDALDVLLAITDQVGGRIGLGGMDPSQMPAQLARNVDNTAALAVSDQGWVGYHVDEALSSPGPLNGDADNTDFVPTIYNINAMVEFMPGTGLNAGAGARFFFFEDAVALFTASEEGLVDRNGDGDTLDTEVLYYTDALASPSVANVVPSSVATLAGITLDGGNAARLATGWIGIAASELANRDLNGDGDNADVVYLLVDARTAPPTIYNTGLSPVPTGAIAGSTIPVTGVGGSDGVVFQVAETANGDLNGDGDNADTLLYYIDFGNPGTAVRLGNTGGLHATVAGGRVAVTASEALTNRDFDGDGSALGFALRIFDNVGQILEGGRTCHPLSVPAADAGDLWAYLRSESAEGSDLNGDGDQADVILGLWR